MLVPLIALLILAWVARHYFQGWAKWFEKKGEQHPADAEAGRELRAATRKYLEAMAGDYRRFKFRGLDVQARGVDPPELDQGYVSLTMVPELDAQPEMAGAKRGEVMEGQLGREQVRPVSLADALEKPPPRLAIIGPAGSGKSTLLQWAGLAVARAGLGQALPEDMRTLIATIGGDPLIPVLVPLREFNRHCKQKNLDRTAATLLDFIRTYVDQENPTLRLPAGFFEGALKRGCLLLLDGLDEVDPDNRKQVSEAVGNLVDERANSPRNRYLISSRGVAYVGTTRVSGFRTCFVQSLAPAQRDQLIRAWHSAVLRDRADEAQRQAEDLSRRIDASDERVRALATTPLMVTIFALVALDRRELPQQRAELYEAAVKILLQEPYKPGAASADLEKWGGLDWEKRRILIARIAFELHQLREQGEAVGEDDLVTRCWNAFGDDERSARDDARHFLQLVGSRGGLLEERDGRYGFHTHRTFKEFLAGRHLAGELKRESQGAFLAARLGDDHWEEPIRLAAGSLAISGELRANEFLLLIAGEKDRADVARAQALTLAGLALSDLPLNRVRTDTRAELSTPMLFLLEANPPRIEPRLRRRLGLALGFVGDSRLRRGGVPELVPVREGRFPMGTTQEQAEAPQERRD